MKTAFWKADWFFGLAVVIALFGFARMSGFIPALERWAYDQGVRMTSKSPSDKIAVIAIDEQSIDEGRIHALMEQYVDEETAAQLED